MPCLIINRLLKNPIILFILKVMPVIYKTLLFLFKQMYSALNLRLRLQKIFFLYLTLTFLIKLSF